jgi:hypothetical protein
MDFDQYSSNTCDAPEIISQLPKQPSAPAAESL